MELPVCGEEEGEKIGSVLTDFYNQMGTLEEAAAKEARAKEMEAKIAAHAAKKKQEEAEAEIRRKEEEEAAAAKIAEEEARLAAKALKKAEEAAAAEARKRAIEEAEAAEAKIAEVEGLAAEAKRAEEDRIAAELAAKKAEEDRIAAELEAKKKAEEERIAAELAAKKAEEDRIAAELEAKKKEEEERIALELEAEKRAEEEAKEDAAVVDGDAPPVDATSNEPAADASSVDAMAITVAEEKKIAEEAAAAETILSEEAESLAEANRVDEEAAAAAAQKKAELEERLARLESLAEEKKAEEEPAAAAAQERVDEKEAALAAEQKAKVEAMLAVAKAQEKAEEEAALAAIQKVHKEAELAAAEKKAQEKKAAEVAATQAATESQPPSVDTGVIHAPMSRELADIRRGELEKIKQARSNIHMSLRGHWEERVKSNDQTHVSLVAAARAKIEKGALLTRYLELQEQSKMRGVVEEDEMMHEDSYQQDREVEPQGQDPVNTNYRKRNSRETAQEFEQRIKLHEQTHVVASTYDEKHHASNHFGAVDKHAFHQQQPGGFEDDWQSAEDALKERMESFRATSDKSPVRDKSKEFTTNKNKSKTSRRALPGGTNEAIPAPDVSLYGDALNAEGTFHANQERGDGYIPMPDRTSKQEASKPLQTRRDKSNESPPAPDVSLYGDALNAEGSFNASQERGDGYIPMPVQTFKQEASKPLQTRREESNESPQAPDVSMYGDAANAEGTFNANQERNDGYIPMPVQTSKQEPSKSVETTEVDDSPVGEKPDEEMEVQTPANGSAEGDTVGDISDENSDKIPDQLPVIKYGGAPEIYEGDETTGENRAQKWHEQATKEGEALDIEEEEKEEEENVKDTEENAAEEDVGEDTTEPDAANNAEEDAEAAKKKAEEEAAAAAKKAEEKAARKEARKAAKRAARAAERAAAKKAEQEAAAAAAAMKATPSTDELANPPVPDAKTGSCTGCIIC
jgi:uncharacterized protein YqiB (DUF1249 family)